MDLSIIIVNWNSKDYLINCLESIRNSNINSEYETIVIDGASYDGCDQLINMYYPEVHFIQSKNNLGFAKANNVAFEHSRGNFILFLNPDTEVMPNAVQYLLDLLNTRNDVGIAGARLLNTDLSIQTSCIQAFPTIINQVLDFEILKRSFPKQKLWGVSPLFEIDTKPKQVDVVSGACLMVRRETFEAIGMFSRDFFMYSDDVDLCYKAYKSGWKTFYAPEAVVVHHGGGSSSAENNSNFSNVLMLESRFRYFKKNFSKSYSYAYRASMFLSCLVRLILLEIFSFFKFRKPDIRYYKFSIDKWKSRIRWTIGIEKWSKNL